VTGTPVPERTIDIWHDEDGRIVAWGYVPAGAPDYLVAEPVARPGRAVLTVSVAEEHLPSLHETHVVDAASGSLRRRAGQD
jgi:hypothetical protein